MQMEFKDIRTADTLREFLIEKGQGHQNYRHYSTLDGIYGMLKSGYIWLSRGDQMNDKQELTKGYFDDWNNIYIASFAFGKSENIAMWGIYGLPHNEAANISFPSKIFSKWVPSISAIYDPGDYYNEINQGFEIQLTDVVYAGGKRGDNDQILRWNDKSIDIDKTSGAERLKYISSENSMTGFIKNFAWLYENEVRIRVKLNSPIPQKKIAIRIPDDMFAVTGNSEKVTITYGPWNQNGIKERKILKFEELIKRDINRNEIIDNINIVMSDFTMLVELKETCNCCQLFYDNNSNIKRRPPSIFEYT